MMEMAETELAADLFGSAVAPPHVHKQLALPLTWCRSAHESDGAFLVGDSNAIAARHLQRFDEWTMPATILIGPHGSGKSLLAKLFVAAGAGEVVDSIEYSDENAVFHAWNRAQSGGQHLLIIANAREQVDAVQLPDLRTRLKTAPIVMIGDPDASLSAALIERLLTGRGLAHTPVLANYITQRIERSYAAIHAAVDAIVALALASGRPLGTRLAREAMIAAGLYQAADSVDAGFDT